jgi:hypothetical protein
MRAVDLYIYFYLDERLNRENKGKKKKKIDLLLYFIPHFDGISGMLG